MPPEPYVAIIAYQSLRLREIRGLYNELDLDLGYYLNVEQDISGELDSLEEEFDEVRKLLSSLGAELREPELDCEPVSPVAPVPPRCRRVESADNFQGLIGQAEDYLARAGLDLSKDPFLQVLDPSEVFEIDETYKDRYGDVIWDRFDYLVVTLAGAIATLLDVFVVRIPVDGAFLGKMQQGSPLTKWLRENSRYVHKHYLSHFEKAAKVPYDLSVGKAVDGLSPKVHRLMSLGHDPILGFIFGVIDILGGTGTFIDKHGDLRRIGGSVNSERLTIAFLKVFLHLLSDVCTSAGIQPPFFTLLQLVKTKSPFVLGSSGERVSWTDVARYMYSHGYDLRHFATMGIVPASVEMIVRGWWLCKSFESREDPELAKAKLTSMLLLAHGIATSGNLLKTGAIYGMNPLALNWAEMLALFPVAMSWMRESMKRNRTIRHKLNAEWASIYRANLEYSARRFNQHQA